MNQWSYEPAPDLQRSIAERLAAFPRYPDLTVYMLRTVAHVALRAYLRTYHRLCIEGRENLPLHESFVLACNHASHLDALCLLSCMPLRRLHRTFPAAAADYFFGGLGRSALAAIFVNGLPFDRQEKGAESLAICQNMLARPQHVLILFPEGTRGTTAEVGRFRSGIVRLVAGTSVPVVPCHLTGAAAAFPKGALAPRPRKLTLRIGAPQRFDRVSLQDRHAVAAACDALRRQVVALGAAGGGS